MYKQSIDDPENFWAEQAEKVDWTKMKFNINQQDLQEALNYCQGVIEKRSTLPILSNILINAHNSKLTITATDLDLIFIHQINNVEVLEEGQTTTTSSIMYDIVRIFS